MRLGRYDGHAVMNMTWLIVSIMLVPPLAVPLAVAFRDQTNGRLAAIQFAGVVFMFLLTTLTFAFQQSTFIDLAVSFALLSVVATYLLALFYERWL